MSYSRFGLFTTNFTCHVFLLQQNRLDHSYVDLFTVFKPNTAFCILSFVPSAKSVYFKFSIVSNSSRASPSINSRLAHCCRTSASCSSVLTFSVSQFCVSTIVHFNTSAGNGSRFL